MQERRKILFYFSNMVEGNGCCKVAGGPGYRIPLEAMSGPKEVLIYVTCVYTGRNQIAKRLHNIDTWCPLCNTEEEDEDSLLISCSFVRLLLFGSELGLRKTNIQDGMVKKVIWNQFVENEAKTGTTLMTEAMTWHIWLARNDTCFHGKKVNPIQTLYQVRDSVDLWRTGFAQQRAIISRGNNHHQAHTHPSIDSIDCANSPYLLAQGK